METSIETIDGYKVLWMGEESVAGICELLRCGVADGIGLNPFRGWRRNFADVSGISSPFVALAIPFGDRIGFDTQLLTRHPEIEMLLLSEFSGFVHIDGFSLRVLRILVTEDLRVEILPNLKVLAMRNPLPKLFVDICQKAPALQSLELNAGKLVDLTGVSNCRNIRSVSLVNAKCMRSIRQLEDLPSLEDLFIESTKRILDLADTISKMKTLKRLRLVDCGVLEDLGFLEALSLQEFRCCRTKIDCYQPDALRRIPTTFVG